MNPSALRVAVASMVSLLTVVAVSLMWPRDAGTPSPSAALATLSPPPSPSASVTGSPSPSPSTKKSTKPKAKASPSTPPKTSKPPRKPKPPAPKPKPPAPKPKPTPKPPPPPGPASPEAKEVLRLTNIARESGGCGPLSWSTKLGDAASSHSKDMASNNYFSHTGRNGSDVGDRINAAGYRWSSYAENIAYGQPTPRDVVDGWMASAGHRQNILNCGLQDLGVGVARSGATGNRPYWTQVFGTGG